MFEKFANPSLLRKKGIMGINQRNHSYIGKYNCRSKFPLVDDKLKTKLIAQKAGITTPPLIGVVDSQAIVKQIHTMVADQSGFVIKPAQGSGGKGILVIAENDGDTYTKASGEKIQREDVERHITNTLAGLFSLGGRNDVAVVEGLIEFNTCFEGFSYCGVPDVRVIVFQGYPTMAMMRLSTARSDGKANLHMGAVGVGIDINSGKAVRAVQFDNLITHHPDSGKELSLLQVPHWERLLTLAAGTFEMTELGYLGTDMVLDRECGPMLLELNARPGLAIQTANGCGIVPRLNHIEALEPPNPFHYPSPEQRVAYAMKAFGNKDSA